jgi:hypothetical protein
VGEAVAPGADPAVGGPAVGGPAVGGPVVGGPVERDLVRDMAKKAAIAGPALVLAFGLIWGVPGALSTAYAVAIVVCNFVLAAALMTWTARLGPAAMGGAALFGFLLRLGLIFLAVMVVRDAWWVELVPLGITIIVTHLGLLFWEMRYVSVSLAHPGLKPRPSASPKESVPQ